MGKKQIGGILVLLIAVASVPLSYFVSLGDYLATYLINGLPALLWGLVLLLGSRKSEALADTKAVILGIIYGGLTGVGGTAYLNILAYMMLDNGYSGTTPYDNAAYAIITLVSMALFFVLLIWDYCKNGEERLWMRVLTALVTVLPTILAALPIMAFFERILSQYV
jgi:hypothetical protein